MSVIEQIPTAYPAGNTPNGTGSGQFPWYSASVDPTATDCRSDVANFQRTAVGIEVTAAGNVKVLDGEGNVVTLTFGGTGLPTGVQRGGLIQRIFVAGTTVATSAINVLFASRTPRGGV